MLKYKGEQTDVMAYQLKARGGGLTSNFKIWYIYKRAQEDEPVEKKRM